MKKILLMMLFVLLIISCSNETNDPIVCKENVQKIFPECVIYNLSNFRFIIYNESTNEIYYAESDNVWNADMSLIKVIRKKNKNYNGGKQ